MQTIVVALGGNALQAQGQPATAENQLQVVQHTAQRIAGLARDNRLLVVHGNGPQVGRLVLQNEYADAITPALPFDVCGAMSQGFIGYHLQQALSQALADKGIQKSAVTVLTQVVVDEADPGFQNPTKPIGPFYSQAEAQAIALKKGYTMKEDAGRGWRRVVASPQPVEIVELPAIRSLLEQGFVPICAGGGGIPVLKSGDGRLSGTAAVIDKDLAAEKLAEGTGAQLLFILTAVERVCLHYGQPEQTELTRITSAQGREQLAQGHFAPGSMGPKVKAAIQFVESGPGRRCVIASLEQAEAALLDQAGTLVVP